MPGGPAVLSIARDITERKRGEEALARWAAQLALLSDVGRQIAAILGVEQVLDRAAQLVHDNFGYHHVALFVDGSTSARNWIMKAIAGDFVKLFPLDHRVPLGQGMVGWVGEHGERLLADDVETEAALRQLLSRSDPDAFGTERAHPRRRSNRGRAGCAESRSERL